MFWGRKKDSDAELKEKSLRELRSAFPSIRRPNNDDTVYELLFEVNSQYNTLRMFFAPDFPSSRPVLQVVGALSQHSWLDQYKRVIGCDKLTQWTKTSSMVDIVSDTLGALQYQTPSSRGAGGGYVMVNNTPLANAYYNTPHVTPSQPAGMAQIYQQHQQQPNSQSHYQPNVHHATQLNTQPIPAYPYNSQNTGGMNQGQIHQANTSNRYDLPPAYTSSNPSSRHGSMTVPTAGVDVSHSKSNSNSNSSSREHLNDDDFPTVTPTLARQTSTQRKVPIPDIPDTFPELENMTETQLEKLVNDEVARAAHIKTMHMVVSMEELKNDLKMSNLNDAKSIVDKKSEINALRGEVAALKTSFTEAVETYRKKAKEVSEKYTVTKGEVLKKENLKISKLDEESEEIASMFSAGKKPLTDFINEYMDKRVAYHELQGKVSAAEKDMV